MKLSAPAHAAGGLDARQIHNPAQFVHEKRRQPEAWQCIDTKFTCSTSGVISHGSAVRPWQRRGGRQHWNQQQLKGPACYVAGWTWQSSPGDGRTGLNVFRLQGAQCAATGPMDASPVFQYGPPVGQGPGRLLRPSISAALPGLSSSLPLPCPWYSDLQVLMTVLLPLPPHDEKLPTVRAKTPPKPPSTIAHVNTIAINPCDRHRLRYLLPTLCPPW